MTRSLKKPSFIDKGLLRAIKRDQKLAEETRQKGRKSSFAGTRA